MFPQRHRVPKFTEASAGKRFTSASRPVSKQTKKFKTHLTKPARPKVAPTSTDEKPPLPPRKPELVYIKPPVMESPPPLPPRKPEPMSALDSHEHAINPNGKFSAAKEKAKRDGVHSLTSEDIQGLSQEQVEELRGY
jgi:hypothetical protein